MLVVSPSPRTLVEQLEPEARIALDLIFELGPEAVERDPRFVALLPEEGRRRYLKTLADQLFHLGEGSLKESHFLDELLAVVRMKRCRVEVLVNEAAREERGNT